MSDDLVERLRSTAIGATLYSTEISDLLNEAARTIERLRSIEEPHDQRLHADQ